MVETKTQALAVLVHEYGDPSVLKHESIELEAPQPNEIRVRNVAIGVNFVDIYFRTGAYVAPTLPFTPGNEGAGIVTAVGSDVRDFRPGDRVAYVQVLGAYSAECNVPWRHAVPLPEQIEFDTAGAMMLKGLTAQYLLRRTFRVQQGQTVLIHSAAGGVGTILSQWAKLLGAIVIGTVGSDEKVEVAKNCGCDFVIQRHKDDLVKRVREVTDGEMCQVVYDGIGKDVFPESIDCLSRFGYWVNYGAASGKVTPFDISLLMQKGSIYATSQLLFDHLRNREDFIAMSAELFSLVKSGAITMPLISREPLSEAAEVHERLESGVTLGATILIP